MRASKMSVLHPSYKSGMLTGLCQCAGFLQESVLWRSYGITQETSGPFCIKFWIQGIHSASQTHLCFPCVCDCETGQTCKLSELPERLLAMGKKRSSKRSALWELFKAICSLWAFSWLQLCIPRCSKALRSKLDFRHLQVDSLVPVVCRFQIWKDGGGREG